MVMSKVFEFIGVLTFVLISFAMLLSWCESISDKIKNRKVICTYCSKKHNKKYSIDVKGIKFCSELCLIEHCKKL